MTETNPKKELFIRYRHGTKIVVSSDIKKDLRRVYQKLKKSKDYKEIFRAIIKPINDGSDLGIHPESTWYCVVKELFNLYETDDQSVSKSTRSILLGLIDVSLDRHTVENKWDEIRKYIIKHIEELSGWGEYFARRNFMKYIKRDKNGKYYQIENGQKIIISGIRTEAEEKFEFIANDCTKKYGHIKSVLNMVALIDIAHQYKYYPNSFSPNIKCLLPENDYNLSILRWEWHVSSSYNYYPIVWKPRNCFSDPEWLSSDLIASYTTLEEFNPTTEPAPAYSQTSKNFTKAFLSYPFKLQIALKTGLTFFETPFSKDVDEATFEFTGRTLIWITGNKFVYPTLIVPCIRDDMADGLEIAHKFISLIVKESGIPVIEISNVGSTASNPVCLIQPRTMGGLGLEYRFVQSALCDNLSENQWVAYALFKEGVNADSDFYAFLSFYKIIELAFNNSNKVDRSRMSAWINTNVDTLLQRFGESDWKQKISTSGETASAHLYNSGRNATAHIKDDRRGVLTNPDSLTDLSNIQEDLRVVRALANEIFEQKLL